MDRDNPARSMALRKLVGAVKDGDAVKAVNIGLQRGHRTLPELLIMRTLLDFGVSSSVDHGKLIRVAPPWFNVIGFYDMISELSALPVMQNFLRKTPEHIKKTTREMLELPNNEELAKQLVINNYGFMNRAIQVALIGAIAGTRTDEVVHARTAFSDGDDGVTIGRDVAIEIGKRFGSIPGSPEELLARIESLVPDSDQTEGLTLYELFLKDNTFVSPYSDVRCPAIHLTKIMLREWAKHLAVDKRYKHRFLESVQI